MSIVLQILSIVIISCAFILIIWRALPNAGIKIARRIDIDTVMGNHTPDFKECIRVFIYVLLFHAFIIFAGGMIYGIFNEKGASFDIRQIAEVWNKWDARHYLSIAEGYTNYIENGDYTTLVFFPLYSWLVKIVKFIVRDGIIAGLVTSAVCSSAACVFMYKLACIDYKKTTAQKAVILMCIFPFSFFFQGVMSESVFLLTSITALYFARRHNWLAAGIAGFFAALSRSVGVFLVFPITIEFIEEYKLPVTAQEIVPKLKLIAKKWLWTLLLPAGTILYLAINYKITGDPLYFLKMEEKYWFQNSQPFFKTVGGLWNTIKGGYEISTLLCSFVPGLALLFGMYALLIYGIRRHRTIYSVWFFVYLIINTSMSWPLSLCRYLSCAVSAYLVLADICERNKKADTAVTIGFAVLFGIYLTAYLMGKQLM